MSILYLLFGIWAFVYTCSYGAFTWRKENKMGAVSLFCLAALAVGLQAVLWIWD